MLSKDTPVASKQLSRLASNSQHTLLFARGGRGADPDLKSSPSRRHELEAGVPPGVFPQVGHQLHAVPVDVEGAALLFFCGGGGGGNTCWGCYLIQFRF